ncbi:spermidine/putrescine ABC transporter substrate-binding protein [Mesorhizobium sp. YM1C-6-2]|uniref:ABC transporter substrate-binding protein n=1 Tax=Mesorhizobium sp. YM1C-6-2 TaxID=1827501 RepID=UPI000EF28795|nr:spermidine/putrescine ABC transporter substrate-binding protein [Mesorhizobium sp. YM1C-6-2]RLP24024.1 spermidine/putrescine ABC transporter substrate-binding protein [Mesorhizobium sp. YM1C-6-2]
MTKFRINQKGLLRSDVSRRNFMGLAGGAAAGLAMSSRGVWAQEATDEFKGKELNVLTWPGHGDPYMVGAFEERYGVRVRVKEYVGGDQLLAVINSTPQGVYDVILADAEVVEQLVDADQIEPLNPADYPFADFFPEFQKFEQHWKDDQLYAVMLRFGYLGLAYNTEKLSAEEVKSYKILWDSKVTGKVGWFDWYLTSLQPLSLYNGNKPPYDISNEAFDKLRETLFSLKPQTAGYFQMADLFSSFANGQAWVVPGIGDWVALLLEDQGRPVKAVVPDEGGLQWTESLSIAKGAKNPELAKRYIQYATSPEGQVKTATLSSYAAAIPNKEGWKLMAKEKPEWADRLRLREDQENVMDQYRKGNIFPRKLPVQQSIEVWNETWTEFKNM